MRNNTKSSLKIKQNIGKKTKVPFRVIEKNIFEQLEDEQPGDRVQNTSITEVEFKQLNSKLV